VKKVKPYIHSEEYLIGICVNVVLCELCNRVGNRYIVTISRTNKCLPLQIFAKAKKRWSYTL